MILPQHFQQRLLGALRRRRRRGPPRNADLPDITQLEAVVVGGLFPEEGFGLRARASEPPSGSRADLFGCLQSFEEIHGSAQKVAAFGREEGADGLREH